ncbi:MAG: NTP transferase domain-containing protein [Deltaproteobacteria bacterium]|nr:NTP transferase domain-containing protein [Deltaproteobacteria bacterium]
MPVTVAYVLAAGLGTRLRPLTNERPKPLLEVCGTPLLEHALRLLARAGIRTVAVNSHWLHPQVPAALGASLLGMRVVTTYEPEVMGTGGGLRGLAAACPAPAGERVLVLNADALIDLDLAGVLKSPDDALATLVLKDDPETARYGAIGTDVDERIVTFAGRVAPRGPVARERMFCGVHVVHPRALEVLPPVTLEGGVVRGAASGINDEGYPRWLEQGALLRGFDHAGTFCDVGTPDRLFEANLAVLTGAWTSGELRPFAGLEERPGRVFVAAGARVHPSARFAGPALVDAGADVGADAELSFAVVGKGCRVAAGARIADAVLQSGAAAAGQLSCAVALPGSSAEVAADVVDRIHAEWRRPPVR